MTFNNELFAKDVKYHRIFNLKISMGEASTQIEISKATMSRIENEQFPDIVTFGKVLNWIGEMPNKYYAKH